MRYKIAKKINNEELFSIEIPYSKKIENELLNNNINYEKHFEILDEKEYYKIFEECFNEKKENAENYRYLLDNYLINLKTNDPIFKDFMFILKINDKYKKIFNNDEEYNNEELIKFMNFTKNLTKERINDTKYGLLYIFDVNKRKKHYSLMFFVYIKELDYYRKPFQRANEVPKIEKDKVTLYIDNFTGIPEKEFEEFKNNCYWNKEYGIGLVFYTNKKAKELLPKIVNPFIRKDFENMIKNMKKDEIIYFSW